MPIRSFLIIFYFEEVRIAKSTQITTNQYFQIKSLPDFRAHGNRKIQNGKKLSVSMGRTENKNIIGSSFEVKCQLTIEKGDNNLILYFKISLNCFVTKKITDRFKSTSTYYKLLHCDFFSHVFMVLVYLCIKLH